MEPHDSKKDSLTQEQLNEIGKVLDDFLDDRNIINYDKSTANQLLFRSILKRRKAWKRRRICMLPECNNRTILRSHTVARASSLHHIAVDGHVLTPRVSSEGRVEAERVGIRHASVFAGFCVRHEDLFQTFEQTGRIENELDVALQHFRSVCREIARLEIEVEQGEEMLKDYIEYRRAALEGIIRDRIPSTDIKLQTVEGSDWVEQLAREELVGRKEELELFTDELYPIAADGLSNPESSGLSGCAFNLDAVIPVCLSGRGNFHVKQAGAAHSVTCILTVIPSRTHTFVSIIGSPEDQDHIDGYVRTRMASIWGFLQTIESWMVYGTDHWFLSPPVWTSVRQGYRRRILDDIIETELSIGSVYPIGIFNDFRRSILGRLSGYEDISLEEMLQIREGQEHLFTDQD